MEKLEKSVKQITDKIKSKTGDNPTIIFRELTLFDTKICIAMDETVADKININKFILEYLAEERTEGNSKDKIKPSNLLKYFEETLPAHKIVKLNNYDDLFFSIYCGFSIFIIDGYDEVLSLETRAKLDSGVLVGQNELVVKGPKDAFSENYQTNIGLIRKRIRSENLRLEELILGTKSKTKVGIMYVNDIANQKLVDMVIDKIKKITIDGIFDSNYIIELISENKTNVFANYLSTERPDQASMYLLDGRITIIVENTQYVVVIPAMFTDFFHTTEDYYQKVTNVNFTRIVRVIAFLVSIFAPAFYIAITTYNIEAIPDKLLLSFVTQRMGVPLPTVLETIMMIAVFEIIKETDSRLPNAIGSSLSVVGAIVLGQAAVMAGIVSPITIIVVSITALSGMITYNMDIVGGARWWRFLFLIIAAMFGLFGIVVAGLLFIINVSSIKSFGIPFLTPLAPFFKGEQNDAIFLSNKRKFEQRSNLTAKANRNKQEASK